MKGFQVKPHHELIDLASLLTNLLLVIFFCNLQLPVQAAEIYVHPEGDDSQPGTADQPFRTLERALDQVALIRSTVELPNEPVTVELADGTYRVSEPIQVSYRHSGTRTSPTIIRAADGTSPVICGGRPIEGWRVNNDGVWRVTMPDVASGDWDFRELFIAGKRGVRAQHPNEGFFRAGRVVADRRTGLIYKPGDIDIQGTARGDLELAFLYDWSSARVRVAAIDREKREITTAYRVGGESRHFQMNHFEKHPRYRLENHPALLDMPGEWYLNRRTGLLRYIPLPGQEPENTEVFAPYATGLFVIRGEDSQPVQHVHLEGLSFEHCAWRIPESGYAGGQACFYDIQRADAGYWDRRKPIPAAVVVEHARFCSFTNGRISHVGTSGLWVGRQTHACVVGHSTFSDISANGIMIGEGQGRNIESLGPWWQHAPEQTASRNVVRDCLIEQVGQQFYGGIGIWAGIVQRTIIEHNEIRDTPYSGISIGWVWKPKKSPAGQNRIRNNHIHRVMQTLSDGGGIYTLGRQPGSVISGNHIHGIPMNAGRAESNGMFFDQGTTGFTVRGNLVRDVVKSPLRFNRTQANTIQSNTLVRQGETPPIRYSIGFDEKLINKRGNTIARPRDFVMSNHRRLINNAGPRTPAQSSF
ncbi:MAG: right-handed parallel beta-helix repeat-containing protein [Planctomycetota bacterium]